MAANRYTKRMSAESANQVRTIALDPRRLFLAAWLTALAVVGLASTALGMLGVLAALDIPGRPLQGQVGPGTAAPLGGIGIGLGVAIAVCIAAGTVEYRRLGAHRDDLPHRQTHTIEQRASAVLSQITVDPAAAMTRAQWEALRSSLAGRLAAGAPAAPGSPLVADLIGLLDNATPIGSEAARRVRQKGHTALRADLMILDAGLDATGSENAA